jgi:hypothetical protein
MEIDVTDSVRAFIGVVEASMPLLGELNDDDQAGSFLDDFMQSNWERIVESLLGPELGFLKRMGGG